MNILFVGDSFTHGHAAPVLYYNAAAITDPNGTGYGGVPGIFKQLTVDAGLNYNVTIEAISSTSLATFSTSSTAQKIMYQPKWNQVFLQDISTYPIPSSRGGNLTKFQNAATSIEQGIHATNLYAEVFLYETWARADLTYPTGQTYSSQPIETMGNDLHNGYYGEAALDAHMFSVSPAGDAWLRAIEEGVAHRDPYDGINDGLLDLWYTDYFHGSIYGFFLNALVHFGAATGSDPRTLGYEKVATDFGISSNNCVNLERVAYETLTNAGTRPIIFLLSTNPVTVEASAIYTDPGATASDVLDGTLTPSILINTVVANRPGSYLLSWTATNSVGLTGSATRTITIVDTTPPAIIVPSNLTVYATTSNGAMVYFTTSATDIVDGSVTTTNIPASGTFFQIGQTTVTTTAGDAAGNITNKTFTVTVTVPPVSAQELKAPQIQIAGANVNLTVQPSVAGRHYQLQTCTNLSTASWQNTGPVLIGNGNNLIISTPFDTTELSRFYQLQLY